MNPLILVGFDLAVSAALILLAMYVTCKRVQSRLESLTHEEKDKTVEPLTPDRADLDNTRTDAPPGAWAFEGVTEEALGLKRKGCSMEQIAQRLQLPTREVEMMLAISKMAKSGNPDHVLHMRFPLEA